MGGLTWLCPRALQWNFFIAQAQHVAPQIQACIMGTQDIQYRGKLVSDIGDEHPSHQWAQPQSQLY
jgi:hypothetical protein